MCLFFLAGIVWTYGVCLPLAGHFFFGRKVKKKNQSGLEGNHFTSMTAEIPQRLPLVSALVSWLPLLLTHT